MKTTHTHRGTCQACGATQAVDNKSRLIAKHGYKVHYIFVGTCPGSDHEPAEFNVDYTREIIGLCRNQGTEHNRLAKLYATRDLMVYTWDKQVWVEAAPGAGRWAHSGRWISQRGRYESRTFPLFGATDEQIEREYELNVDTHERIARDNFKHIAFLKEHVFPRFGQPLYAVTDIVKAVKAARVAKTAPIEGAYRTKQAQKDALETLSRDYRRLREIITTLYLAIPHDQRDDLGQKVYYAVPHDLHAWRPKTSALVLKWNDGLAGTVAKIEELRAQRDVIKSRPIIK